MNTSNNIARALMNSSSQVKLEVAFQEFSGTKFLGASVESFAFDVDMFSITFLDNSTLISNENGFKVA